LGTIRPDLASGSDCLCDDHHRCRRLCIAGWMDSGPHLPGSEPTRLLSSTDMATLPLCLLMGTFAMQQASPKTFTQWPLRSLVIVAAVRLRHHRRRRAFWLRMRLDNCNRRNIRRIALPQMLRRGYSPSFATGTIAAGGTLQIADPAVVADDSYCIVAKHSSLICSSPRCSRPLLTILLILSPWRLWCGWIRAPRPRASASTGTNDGARHVGPFRR